MKKNSKDRQKSTRSSKKALSLYARGERPVSSIEIAAQTLSPFAHATNVFFFTYSPKSKALLSWSTNASQVLGVKDAEILREGNLFLRHVHPRDRFLILSNLDMSLEGKRSYESTYRWIRPDNHELRWLHCRAHLSPVGDDKVFEGLIIDLSSLYEHSSTTRGYANADTLLAALNNVLLLFDSEGRLLYQSGMASDGFTFGDPHFKKEEVKTGRSLEGVFSDRSHYLRHTTALEKALDGTEVTETLGCGTKTFEVTYQSIVTENDAPQVIVRAYDVSQEQHLLEEVKKLSKTASYQIITSGVVHNINNALQAIIGEASSAYHNSQEPLQVRATTDRIIKLAHRTADLTHELLDLNSDLLSEIDPNICVMTALNRTQDFLPAGMLLDVSFGNIEPCLGRQRSLTECLVELIKAVWQGVSATHTSLRTISTDKMCNIEICVSGNATPTVPAITEHNIHSVAQSHNIPLSYRRNQFDLTITVSIPHISPDRRDEHFHNSIRIPKVVIVDDDPLVGETISALLSQEHVSSIVFQHPLESLSYIVKNSNSIELVIVDALMPTMSGELLIKEIRKVNHDIAILGFTGAPRMLESLLKAGASDVVLKPLDPLALKRLVHKHLQISDGELPLVGNS